MAEEYIACLWCTIKLRSKFKLWILGNLSVNHWSVKGALNQFLNFLHEKRKRYQLDWSRLSQAKRSCLDLTWFNFGLTWPYFKLTLNWLDLTWLWINFELIMTWLKGLDFDLIVLSLQKLGEKNLQNWVLLDFTLTWLDFDLLYDPKMSCKNFAH